jgi:hypothetical protein
MTLLECYPRSGSAHQRLGLLLPLLLLHRAGCARYLLLDGRSNTELAGVKALRRLSCLRALVLPLLHLHHADKGLLVALTLALPHTIISNISASFGMHHGCQVGATHQTLAGCDANDPCQQPMVCPASYCSCLEIALFYTVSGTVPTSSSESGSSIVLQTLAECLALSCSCTPTH